MKQPEIVDIMKNLADVAKVVTRDMAAAGVGILGRSHVARHNLGDLRKAFEDANDFGLLDEEALVGRVNTRDSVCSHKRADRRLMAEAGVPITASSDNATSVGVCQTRRRASISKKGRHASGRYCAPPEQAFHTLPPSDMCSIVTMPASMPSCIVTFNGTCPATGSCCRRASSTIAKNTSRGVKLWTLIRSTPRRLRS